MDFDNSTDTITPDAVGDAVITIAGTGGLKVPVGTTAERPADTLGLLRFNTTINNLEFNFGGGWSVAGGGESTVSGIAPVDFGTGNTDASVSVSSALILVGATPVVRILPGTTINNTLDDHLIEDLTCIAHSVVPGVGFTIYVKCNTLRAHGIYNITWSYT